MNLILSSNFYQETDTLFSLINSMEFDEFFHGFEIKDFNYIPEPLTSMFSSLLKEDIEIQPDTGVFRKPKSMISIEPFYQHVLWKCIVALEDTTLRIYEQENIKTMFDVEDVNQFILNNSFDESKWNLVNTIKIRKNEFVFIRPWLWHSMEENKLTQVFLLNRLLNDSKECE